MNGKLKGKGTLISPYLVEDAYDLDQIRYNRESHFKLINDIDMGVFPYNAGTGWIPIGHFNGTLNGNGCNIKNLYMNNPTANNQSLFGQILFTSNNSRHINFKIFDLSMTNFNIVGDYGVAPLVSTMNFSNITTNLLIENLFFENIHLQGKLDKRSTTTTMNYFSTALGHFFTASRAITFSTIAKDIYNNIEYVGTGGYSTGITMDTTRVACIENFIDDARINCVNFSSSVVIAPADTNIKYINCYTILENYNSAIVNMVTVNKTIRLTDFELVNDDKLLKNLKNSSTNWTIKAGSKPALVRAKYKTHIIHADEAYYTILNDKLVKVSDIEIPHIDEVKYYDFTSLEKISMNIVNELKAFTNVEIFTLFTTDSNKTHKEESIELLITEGDNKNVFSTEIIIGENESLTFSI